MDEFSFMGELLEQFQRTRGADASMIGTSPQPWKLGLRSAPKTPKGHGKCPGTLFKEFWHSQGRILPWPEQGHKQRERLPPIVWDCQGSQVPQAVAPVIVGLVAGKVTCNCRFCGERSANLQEVNR